MDRECAERFFEESTAQDNVLGGCTTSDAGIN